MNVDPIPSPVDLDRGFSVDGEAPLPDKWWLSFNDPELAALIDVALAENFTLKTAWDRLEAAKANVQIAGAELWPALDARASNEFALQRFEVLGPEGETDFETDDFRSRSFDLVADYEVDLWGRIRSLRNAEALDLLATREDLEAAAISLSAEVASTWYQLQEATGQVALLDKQLETTQVTLELIEGRFRLGLVRAADVLQQRQLVESRREERAQAIARQRVLEVTLAILLGQTPGPEMFDVDGDLIALPPLPETGLPAQLVARRPDVEAAYRAVQAADQRLGAAIANKYPRLSLTAGYSTSDEDWRGLFDTWIATLGQNVVAPIVDGGARRAEVERNEALTAESFHRYGQTILEALGEVEQALAREVQQYAAVESIEKQLELARQVLQRIRAQYLAGTENYLRVLEAQESVQFLERTLLIAQRALIEFRVDLCRALAGGWELDPPRPEPALLEEPGDFYPLPI